MNAEQRKFLNLMIAGPDVGRALIDLPRSNQLPLLLSPAEVEELTGLGASTIGRLQTTQQFPPYVAIAPRRKALPLGEFIKWYRRVATRRLGPSAFEGATP